MGLPATYDHTLSSDAGEAARAAPSPVIPFGLFELDPAGTVIRYSPASESAPADAADGIRGRNFFTDIAPVEQVVGFRLRFHSFMASGQAVERFATTFAHGRQNVKVQIMMAHITEKSEDGRRRLALVRIMPE